MTLWFYGSCVWLFSITPKVTETGKYWSEKKAAIEVAEVKPSMKNCRIISEYQPDTKRIANDSKLR